MKRTLLAAVLGALCFGCASTYKPIFPDDVSFSATTQDGGLKMQYKYDVLADAGNRKYAKKEDRRRVRIVAVNVQNNTGRAITLGRDAELYSGKMQLFPLTGPDVKQELRQVKGLYMIWSIVWVVLSKCDDGDCSTIPLPVGLVIGLANMGTAGKANNDLLYDFNRHNITDKTIPPGESVTGLIAVRGFSGQEIRLRLKPV